VSGAIAELFQNVSGALLGGGNTLCPWDTRDDLEAAQRHARVHLEAERQFASWRAEAAGVPTQHCAEDEWVRGLRFLSRSGLDYIPLDQLRAEHEANGAAEHPSEFERRLGFVEDRLGIATDDMETRDGAINDSLEARAVLGVLQRPLVCLSGALQIYLAEKAADLSSMAQRSARGFRLERERVIAGLRTALGEDKPIQRLTRSDARLFRDFLVARQVAASTVNKYVRIAHTIVGTAIRDHDLSIRNPFESLRVEDEMPDIDRRHPLSQKEIKLVLAARQRINGELADILVLLVCTGARLNEIAGLEIADVQPLSTGEGPSHLWIRPNRTRSLKSVSSRRKVPLIGPAVVAATNAVARVADLGHDEGPLFPRYGRNGGRDAASQALMKFLRRIGITDRRKVIHSIRHSVKQALRDVGCPKDVRDAIQGHSITDVAETYGSGVGLEAKREWLQAAMGSKFPDA
jgi:integrase